MTIAFVQSVYIRFFIYVIPHRITQAEALKLNDLATKCAPAFSTEGFEHWKKALENFADMPSARAIFLVVINYNKKLKLSRLTINLFSKVNRSSSDIKMFDDSVYFSHVPRSPRSCIKRT